MKALVRIKRQCMCVKNVRWFLVWTAWSMIHFRKWEQLQKMWWHLEFKKLHLLPTAGPVHFAGVIMKTSDLENVLCLGHGDEQKVRMTQWHDYVVKLKVSACSKCSSMQSTTFDEVRWELLDFSWSSSPKQGLKSNLNPFESSFQTFWGLNTIECPGNPR